MPNDVKSYQIMSNHAKLCQIIPVQMTLTPPLELRENCESPPCVILKPVELDELHRFDYWLGWRSRNRSRSYRDFPGGAVPKMSDTL